MTSKTIVRASLVAAGALAATMLAGTAAQAGPRHEDRHPGMERMHELMRSDNPGMERMHQRMMQTPGMDRMHERMHDGATMMPMMPMGPAAT
jgi:hypothetical protein